MLKKLILLVSIAFGSVVSANNTVAADFSKGLVLGAVQGSVNRAFERLTKEKNCEWLNRPFCIASFYAVDKLLSNKVFGKQPPSSGIIGQAVGYFIAEGISLDKNNALQFKIRPNISLVVNVGASAVSLYFQWRVSSKVSKHD